MHTPHLRICTEVNDINTKDQDKSPWSTYFYIQTTTAVTGIIFLLMRRAINLGLLTQRVRRTRTARVRKGRISAAMRLATPHGWRGERDDGGVPSSVVCECECEGMKAISSLVGGGGT